MSKKFSSIIACLLVLALVALPVFAENDEDTGIIPGDAETTETTTGSDEGNETEEPEAPDDNADGFVFNDNVRVGEVFSVSFRLTTDKCYAVMGGIDYDPQTLSYKGCSGFFGSWNVSVADDAGHLTFIAVDTLLSIPAEGQNVLFDLTFVVSSEAEQGSKIVLSAKDMVISDGISDKLIDDVSSTATLGRALGDSPYLRSLDIGHSLAPLFAPEITEYSATVAKDVSEIKVDASADELSVITVSDSSLEYGENEILINVTSENGKNTTVYKITVFREAPADISSEARLAGVTVSAGQLAPAFTPDVHEYAVIISDATETVELVPTTMGEKASAGAATVSAANGSTAVITCTAEDGTVIEYRFSVYNTYVPTDSEKDPQGSNSDDLTGQQENNGKQTLLYLVFGVVLALIAFSVGFMIAFFVVGKNKKSKNAKIDGETTSGASEPQEDSDITDVDDGESGEDNGN